MKSILTLLSFQFHVMKFPKQMRKTFALLESWSSAVASELENHIFQHAPQLIHVSHAYAFMRRMSFARRGACIVDCFCK